MERMSFYIPPVFLFGNKVRHNQEEEKSEYKTAAETEFKVENWNIKRIAELEEENKVIKEEKEMLIKQNTLLQESNKKLKDKLSKREQGECRYFGNDGETDLYECMEDDTIQEIKDIGEL